MLLRAFMAALAIIFTAGCDRSASDEGLAAEQLSTHVLPATNALVFAYGVEIEPPITFSGIGTDTLRMNGFPVHPVRALASPDPMPLPVSPDFVPLPYEVRAEREQVMKLALEVERHAIERKSGVQLEPEEIASTAARVFKRFWFIRETEAAGEIVRFGFIDEEGYHGMAWSNATPHMPRPLGEVHQRIIDAIEGRLRIAEVYAMGSDYELACGVGCGEKTVRALRLVREGSTLGELEDWGLFQDAKFLRDVRTQAVR